LPKPTVTLQPSWPQIYSGVIYSGETVTVRCEIQGGEGAQWTYEWRPDKLNTPPTSNEYTISSVTESDGGGYSCRGTRSSSWTEWSDVITLNVKLHIKPTVTLQPSWTQIYSGETVTVRCDIQGAEGAQWTYEWRQNKLNTPPTSSEYRIIRVTESDSGGYSCRGRRSFSWTEWSDITTLKVTAPPKPTVTLQPSWPQIYSVVIYSGETVTVRWGSVTLTCDVKDFADIEYEFRKTSSENEIISFSSKSAISVSDGGIYTCRGSRRNTNLVTTKTPPKPTVILLSSGTQIYSGVIYSGETVTVRCEIQGGDGAQWTYEWRPDKLNTPPTSSEYTISSATKSDAGEYSCRGTRSSSWTKWSDITTLTVSPPPKPTVFLQPSKTQIYSGETVIVRCEIQGGEGAQWTYEWSPAELNTPPTSSEYRISSATQSDSGGYSCRGRRGSFYTERSESIMLTVS
ncbi:leukocyte immunoglobulin-like receptor subfamily A member 6, partial [Neolamprologus brichardi]|uniref:leukocyte immunoglobulin-like receptor subfamily A member 6 n=1 Tax=Neolamprologus brichardi TaxID=32507 RepID=UPI0016439A56